MRTHIIFFTFLVCLICTTANAQETVTIHKEYDYITRYEAMEAMGLYLGQSANCSPEGTITHEKNRVQAWLEKTCQTKKEVQDLFSAFISGAKDGININTLAITNGVAEGKSMDQIKEEIAKSCAKAKAQYQLIILAP